MRCGPTLLAAAISLMTVEVRAEAAEPKPVRVVPERKTLKERRAERRGKDWSEGGRRRGILELTLGGITASVAVLLIARGGWELHQGKVLGEACAEGSDDLACGIGNPVTGSRIAAGLSFGFAVPIAIASGFLFARGARTHRDYKAWKARQSALTINPYVGGGGGGLVLHGRF